MKKKLHLLILTFFLTGMHVSSQVLMNENFNSSIPPGWNAGTYSQTTTDACDIGSIRHNLYSFSATTNTSSYTQVATGNDIVVSLDYKVIDWSGGAGTMGNFGTMNLQYTINGGTSWINYDVIDNSNHVVSTQCATRTFTIPAASVPTGSSFAWKLNGTWGAGDYYFYIDNFSAVEQVSCMPPSALNVTNVTATTLDFGWTENNGSGQWQVDYGAIGFTPGTGTSVAAIPYTAAITLGSEYDFYVRSVCSVNDVSAWAGPYQFKYCDVSSQYTFYYLSAINSIGAVANVSYSAGANPAGGYANETAQTFESFEAQTFTLNTTYSSPSNAVNVWVDWNKNMIFEAAELMAGSGSSAAAQALSVTIPTGTAQGDYRMRVRSDYGNTANPPACGSTAYGSAVDFKLTIIAPPSCLPPTSLTAANITATTAELGWTENNGSSSWNIEYGIAGFALGNGTQPTGPISNPYTATIAANTAYEFYVQTDCGGGDLSAWAGPYAFSNVYCLPVYTSTGEYLSLMETVGAIADVSHTASAFPAPNGYTDETAQILEVYETLTFDLNSAYNPSNYSYVVRMWVDFNNDFVFDHATELISSASGGPGSFTQQVTIPAGTPVGTYRVRVRGEYSASADPFPCSSETWGSAADFTMSVITPPTCLPVMDIDTVSVSTTSIELSWTELNSATSWEIEYGLSGFAQGTGTFATANTNLGFTILGLNPSAQYDFYIQADCGGGDLAAWRGPFSMYTDCGIAVAPFYEGFSNAVQPQCWENLSSNTSTGVNNFWKFTGQAGYAAANNGRTPGTFAWVDGDFPYGDSVILISPQIDISQLATPYLSFEWFSNNTNTPGDNVPLIIEVNDGTSWTLLDTLRGDSPNWEFVNYDLSAFTGNVIQVRFMVNKSVTTGLSYYNDILLDEFRVADCISLGGQDGMFDVCRLDSTVNLEANIIVKPNGGGVWSFPGQPAYVVDDTVFNVQFLPVGSYDVYYVERYVCYDTTTATINVFGPSSAGMDGTTTVCKNEPIDLFSALSGNIDMGGEWYDFNNAMLANAQPKAEPIPGQYNFNYIVTNGVCPADTAVVEVSVKADCDWLSLEEELFTDISVYPNPATSQLIISNPSNATSLKVEMLDMNGRIVLVENKALNNATETTLAIGNLERGIYTLRIYNNEGQKTFKIVKQ
jgi:hypothetical protein